MWFINDLQLLANEGDTVEPGHKIAIISRSADATTHVAPSEPASEPAAPKPTPKTSEPEEKKAPKVETAPKTEKPKAPAPQSSPSEPQLPPKDRETRVSHCDFVIIIASWIMSSNFVDLMSSFITKGSYDKATKTGCYPVEGFPKYICHADNLQWSWYVSFIDFQVVTEVLNIASTFRVFHV